MRQPAEPHWPELQSPCHQGGEWGESLLELEATWKNAAEVGDAERK